MELCFNNFLNKYLRIFNYSFPLKKYYNKHTNQGRLTKGIKISCHHKRDLYMLCKETNNSKIKKIIIKHTVKSYLRLSRWPKGNTSITLLSAPKIKLKQCGI